LTHEKHCIQISKHNNAHGEESGQVEKAKIDERLWIGWIESFVGQFRLLVNSVRWSSEVSIGTLEKIDTIWQSRVWKASSLQRHNTQT
ncbi:hypothetical protein T12_13987, partial [Trichinella patagoniensis]